MYKVKVRKDAVSKIAEVFADEKTVVANAVAFKLVEADGYRVSISLAPCFVDLMVKDGKAPDLEDGIQQVKRKVHEAIAGLTFKEGVADVKESGDTKEANIESRGLQPVPIHPDNNG